MIMNLRNVVVVTVVASVFVYASAVVSAQQPAASEQVDTYDLRLVRNALRDPERAIGFSVTEKQINRLGDKMAIALIKIYSEKELVDATNVLRYLPLIEAAFAAPRIVPNPDDRRPAVTMLLLHRLEAGASNDVERRRVHDLQRYVQAQMLSQ
jgi:hypothetical protein